MGCLRAPLLAKSTLWDSSCFSTVNCKRLSFPTATFRVKLLRLPRVLRLDRCPWIEAEPGVSVFSFQGTVVCGVFRNFTRSRVECGGSISGPLFCSSRDLPQLRSCRGKCLELPVSFQAPRPEASMLRDPAQALAERERGRCSVLGSQMKLGLPDLPWCKS